MRVDVAEDPLISDRFLTAVRADLPALTDEIVDALRTRIADYRGLHETWHREAVREAIEHILLGFLGEQPPAVRREIGRSEQRIGRSPEALHAAFWLGARLCWRRWTRLGRTCGLSPEQTSRLGEMILAHAENVARGAAEGFASAEDTGAPADQAQERLANLLLSTSSPAPDLLAEAAQAARWPLPKTAVVVALLPGASEDEGEGRAAERGTGRRTAGRRGTTERGTAHRGTTDGGTTDGGATERGTGERGAGGGGAIDGIQIQAPSDVLPGLNAGPVLIVPGPDAGTRAGRAGQWVPGDWLAVCGPAVPVTSLRASWRVARGGAELVRRGVLARPEPGAVLRAADHLEAVVLLQDDDVLGVLVDRYLRPLGELSAKQRERMVDTVLAWLTCGESVPATAARLAVHPQTVHYRLRQARNLFGRELLGDPVRRLELTMALRAVQLVR